MGDIECFSYKLDWIPGSEEGRLRGKLQPEEGFTFFSVLLSTVLNNLQCIDDILQYIDDILQYIDEIRKSAEYPTQYCADGTYGVN